MLAKALFFTQKEAMEVIKEKRLKTSFNNTNKGLTHIKDSQAITDVFGVSKKFFTKSSLRLRLSNWSLRWLMLCRMTNL
ncbi:unnamed protein product [Linum trigynum]|uniref:Uncharacterized protein n=1 Tax=Linum trigynum TaxID=586398 RepID=A0AAV2GMQ5_9ROSI